MSAATEIVLVTGASAGLGLELASLFAADGAELILVARREERLVALAERLAAEHGTRAHVIPMDLAEPGAPEELASRIEALGLRVDVLINNAGFGARGAFAELPLDRQTEMLQVNVVALTRLTRIFLPAMIERRYGGVMNLGSLSGFLPGPGMSVYYATKAFVLSLTEGLAGELRGTGVRACCVTPGPTETEFVVASGIEGVRFFRFGAMEASDVASTAYRGFRHGDVVVVPGARVKLSAFLLRFSPRPLTRRIAGWMNG
jgi:uncharacterized protein